MQSSVRLDAHRDNFTPFTNNSAVNEVLTAEYNVQIAGSLNPRALTSFAGSDFRRIEGQRIAALLINPAVPSPACEGFIFIRQNINSVDPDLRRLILPSPPDVSASTLTGIKVSTMHKARNRVNNSFSCLYTSYSSIVIVTSFAKIGYSSFSPT